MNNRADKDLAFMLEYENVAWYENGAVRILDRRIYPASVKFVVCRCHEEVAKAIGDMVTQSEGPYSAARMGMALAAFEVRDKDAATFEEHMAQAARTLAHARPTTVRRMEGITAGCLEVARKARLEGVPADAAVFGHAVAALEEHYGKGGVTAGYLVDMFPKKGTVMTQCFAETLVGMMLRVARERGLDLRIICPETRPYFQGARLTASVARDMGYDVTVITDNMPAHTIQQKKVDVFTSASDIICMDGHVVNKVGTFQIAIVANYFGIPYFVTGVPDPDHATIDTVDMEERDGELCLQAMGVRTAKQGVKGYYPAFDATPPCLVNGVVTQRGVFSAYDLHRYFEAG